MLKHKNYNPISDADQESREGFEKHSTLGVNTHMSREFDAMSMNFQQS